MEVDNLIEFFMKMFPIVAVIFGIVLFSVKKYTEKHDSVLIKRIIKSF